MCRRLYTFPKFKNKALVNLTSFEVHELHCKSWKCPDCAKKKRINLYHSMLNFFKDAKAIPMWTFTASSRDLEPLQHMRLMQNAFHTFLKECRRNPLITASNRKFKYVRILELHKSGYVHYHILTNRAVDYHILQAAWEHACILAGFPNTDTKFCNVNCIWKANAKHAASYIVKYVLKAVEDFPDFISRWSKSKNTEITTKYISPDKWQLVDFSRPDPLGFLYSLHISEKAQSSEKITLFEASPPV